MRREAWAVFLTVALAVVACGGTPQPASSGGSPGQAKNVGQVAFQSSQGQPVNEAEGVRKQVLPAFNGSASFDSSLTDAQITDKLLAEHQTGKSSFDVVAMAAGSFPTLKAADALEDLTPLAQKLEKDRKFNAKLLDYGKLGTQKQYYIPWIQATYMLVVNKQKAMQYLPKGADANNLTYDQLITWGENIQKATGEKKLGLPAAPGSRGGLYHRFLQGYAYPSYTGTEVSGFKSADGLRMWQMMKRLWAVTNPQSTNYAAMQDPLQNGEVWVAWDHQARVADALKNMGDQFQVLPAPSGPKGLGFMSAVIGVAIPKNAPNRAGAEALIDFLTKPDTQVKTGSVLSFFPVLDGVKLSGSGVPGYLAAESTAAARYNSNTKAVAALLPVGLGTRSDEFNKAYQDSFARILLRNEDIQTVLDDEGAQLQKLLNDQKAPCWPPDPAGSGPCQIK
jgi:multiple sugar transport system substrate-binding protein